MWEKFGENYWNIYPRRAVEHFLNLKNPPTAIIAPYPLLSRIHKILCEKGVRVPQDISLASMNYTSEVSASVDFTRIVYDEEKMLFWGIDRLLAKLADRYSSEPEYYFQKPVFISGETTAVLSKNQNHQLSWWYALCLEGINTGSPTRALNKISVASSSLATAEAVSELFFTNNTVIQKFSLNDLPTIIQCLLILAIRERVNILFER